MATFTAKAGLRKPATSEPVVVGSDINDNYDKIDANLGRYVCTSSTRPTGSDRFVGQGIYETDTKSFLIWDGTIWQFESQVEPVNYDVTMAGITLGNGSKFGKYHRVGNVITCWGRILWGSTTTESGAFFVGGWPFTSVSLFEQTHVGTCMCVDDSAGTGGFFLGSCELDTTTRIALIKSSGGLIGATDPFTWTTNDILRWKIQFEIEPT